PRGFEWFYWDRRADGALLTIQTPAGFPLRIVYSPDGSRIAEGGLGKAVRVWDAATGEPAAGPGTGFEARVLDIAYSRDGSRIAAGSLDGRPQLWAAATGARLALLNHRDPKALVALSVVAVGFSPDAGRLTTCGSDGSVRVWDVATGSGKPPFKLGAATR